MIVMGASSRAGDALFFGNTASAVFRDWKNPLLLIVSGS
jgi:nucleotide-binding universal stress UspA family protein